MGPFHKKVAAGIDPDTAWEQTKAIVEKKTRYGTWQTDFFVSGPDDSARFCHINEIKCARRPIDTPVALAGPAGFRVLTSRPHRSCAHMHSSTAPCPDPPYPPPPTHTACLAIK